MHMNRALVAVAGEGAVVIAVIAATLIAVLAAAVAAAGRHGGCHRGQCGHAAPAAARRRRATKVGRRSVGRAVSA